LSEDRTPDLSIQDGKKRFGGFSIVFMGIRAVTVVLARSGHLALDRGFGLIKEATTRVGSGDCAGRT
jgi:hypothetical protein